jgi:hypothetical protein
MGNPHKVRELHRSISVGHELMDVIVHEAKSVKINRIVRVFVFKSANQTLKEKRLIAEALQQELFIVATPI